ncbi:MAG: carboxypeptidase regulatory-like domain-containing protein, partial [Myxococcaceae bacterium]|nr:carboxypeptidase regulatory-like domain-containing protein [Myxococcaceae bacterium]
MLNFRVVLFAAVCGSALMGCPSPKPATDGGAGGTSGECFEDLDCPDERFFFCNTTTSQCEPACSRKADCSPAERGEFALPECDTADKCQCDEGKCVASLCSSDADCGGTLVCRSGACVTAPAAADVASCSIVPDRAVLKGGTTQKFTVFGVAANGDPVVVKEGAMWTGGTVAPAAGNSTVFTAPMTAGMSTLTATIGTKTCTATIEALDPVVPAGEVAIVVTDELTGRGIMGATVIASNALGAQIGNSVTTGANGYAKLTGMLGTEVNVTVFHSAYNYLTIANYEMMGSRFLSAVLRRHQNDKYGGQRGTFTGVPMSSNVHAAISGMSIAGS